jgi:MFS family permease
MAILALPLLVLARTGNPLWAALAASPQPLAYVLVGLVAGAIVDRRDSRRTMITCDCIRAAIFGIIAWLTWTGDFSAGLVLVLAVLAAASGVFFDTASAVLVQRMLHSSYLVGGNARLELSNQFGHLLGPALAGIMATAVGMRGCLLLNTASYSASLATLALIPGSRRFTRSPQPLSLRQITTDLSGGISYLRADRCVRTISLLQTVVNFAVGAETLIVFFASRTLHGNPVSVSLVVSSAAAGGILAALIAGPAGRRWAAWRIIIGAIFALAASLLLASQADTLTWLGAANFGIGCAGVLATIHIRALRQRVVPADFLGRVTSAARTLAVVAYPAGAVLGGWLTAATGRSPRAAFALAGILGFASAGIALARQGRLMAQLETKRIGQAT